MSETKSSSINEGTLMNAYYNKVRDKRMLLIL